MVHRMTKGSPEALEELIMYLVENKKLEQRIKHLEHDIEALHLWYQQELNALSVHKKQDFESLTCRFEVMKTSNNLLTAEVALLQLIMLAEYGISGESLQKTLKHYCLAGAPDRPNTRQEDVSRALKLYGLKRSLSPLHPGYVYKTEDVEDTQESQSQG
ncbi:hypothetical protein K488DRAFT_91221 [Vararia minispora EC-137]|uniref:Uncharacterized protein n=1 Tax=Vararia minispora EC-137 TaxID=1314806 RepID=A0ACB8Q5X8_9AGAM|nr:hypothetical protein K488DRAFT_91221 [Vararia minispora EC-137]